MTIRHEEIKQIEYMIELINKCMRLHLSSGDHKKAKLCIVDICYLEKKLKQVKKRTYTRKVKIEVNTNEADRSK